MRGKQVVVKEVKDKTVCFPEELTAEMLTGFKTTPHGCTHPREGWIAGCHFIAKCGTWSAYSSGRHVHNELVADELLREAGLNVPPSREYYVDFGEGRGPETVRLAVYDDSLTPIMEAWSSADAELRRKIRAQAIAAYPVQALIAGIDTFTWDNVKVDPEGKLWFVDNGASFDYRASGKRKGWFWMRKDADDPASGYLSLAKHPDQYDLRQILGKVDDAELWAAAAKVKFAKLVAKLPDSHRSPALAAYAKALDDAAAKNNKAGRGCVAEANLDKVRGCLFGGAVGDALGYPVEFMGEEHIRSHFGKGGICGYELDPKTGTALVSDDTQMTLFTATGLLVGDTRGKLRGVMGDLWSYIAGHYEDWLRTQEQSADRCLADLKSEVDSRKSRYQHSWLVNEPRLFHHRAPGMTCLSAIRKRRGNWPNGAPSKFPVNDSKGCGGVMRVAPVGLYFSDPCRNMEMVDRAAAEAAAFTHSHSLGYMPAAVLAHIVNRLVYPVKGKRKPMGIKDAVCEARDAAKKLFAGDGHLGELVEIIDRAVSLAEGCGDDLACIHELGEGWVAEEALAIAVFCALRHQNDFSAGVIAAVNHKGDSDSTGAIAGNILGAHLGYAAIDDKWKKNLELSDVILELSGDLCRKCQMNENGPAYDSAWMAKYGCAVPQLMRKKM